MTDEIKPKKPIWKKWWFWLLIIFVIIIIASANGSKPTTTPKSTETTETGETPSSQTPQSEKSWQAVNSWEGTGIKNTEPFTITGNQWRINWSNKDTTGFGGSILQISVYKPGANFPIEMAANAQGTASDTSYVYESGEFYLNVNSANGNWAISVEDFK